MAKEWLTRSYNFIDKDPEIDNFRTLWQKDRIKENVLAVLAGLSPSTVRNMFGGETRRPQHATFEDGGCDGLLLRPRPRRQARLREQRRGPSTARTRKRSPRSASA